VCFVGIFLSDYPYLGIGMGAVERNPCRPVNRSTSLSNRDLRASRSGVLSGLIGRSRPLSLVRSGVIQIRGLGSNAIPKRQEATRSGTMRMLFPGRASAVFEVGALSDLDNISVRIADVAACLAVLGDRCRDELRSSAFP